MAWRDRSQCRTMHWVCRNLLFFSLAFALPLTSKAVDPSQLGLDSVANYAVYASNSLVESGSPVIVGDSGQNIPSVSAKISSVSSYAASLTPTLTLSGVLSSNLTITGNGGYSVISLAGINYSSNRHLTLQGGANDVFVFDITGSMTIGGSALTPIILSGVATNHVLFNFLGTSAGADVLNVTVGSATLFGTFIAPSASMSVAADTVYGGLFADGNNLTLNSSTVIANVFSLPEPSSFALVGISCLFGLGLKLRRRR